MNPPTTLEHRAKVEEFCRKHRIRLLTLLFTDLVGSTKLKQELGDREAVALIQRHHALVREIPSRFQKGEEIGTASDASGGVCVAGGGVIGRESRFEIAEPVVELIPSRSLAVHGRKWKGFRSHPVKSMREICRPKIADDLVRSAVSRTARWLARNSVAHFRLPAFKASAFC